MSTTVKIEVQPVQPGEYCERNDCPANALVATKISPEGAPDEHRLTWCKHHFDKFDVSKFYAVHITPTPK
jgi:hypothetical protein